MPAPAVIPAPIAYIKFVAVKKLVVGFRVSLAGPPLVSTGGGYLPAGDGLLGLIVRDSESALLL